MKSPILSALLLLAGCPYLGDGTYDEKVRDLDGDGFISDRFGGPDCRDDDPDIGNCDADGDGHIVLAAGGDDCDDGRADVFPGAQELCNRIDDDCDGLIDSADVELPDDTPLVYADRDADGFGDPAAGRPWCDPEDPPAGYTGEGEATDCDDAASGIYPGAVELCDAIDHNCDGDPTAGAAGAPNWYEDTDGDGVGAGFAVTVSCTDPGGGLSPSDQDCAPDDPGVFPGNPEIPYDGLDQDCDEKDANDLDNDTFLGGPDGDDCDDTRSVAFPGAAELCNGRDDDCDGESDEGALVDYYPDVDGDLQGDATADPIAACTAPAGYVSNRRDCDDDSAAVREGAVERCNGIDDDCDGLIDDEAVDRVIRYRDADDDLFGDPSQRAHACLADLDPAYRWVEDNTDCDDAWTAAHPGSVEVCDDHDNDCNGATDEGVGNTYYPDNDGDGFGNGGQPRLACNSQGGELSAVPGDCNDADPASWPGAPEICGDDFRQDCSTNSPYDCDDDGFEDILVGGDDCDDAVATVYPGANEICDGYDNDCDGRFDDDDDDVDVSTIADWYLDADEDGFAPALAPLVAAQACAPIPGAATVFGDCDDGDAKVFPGAAELCNLTDDDCDGTVDDVPPADQTPWYRDADRDGHGSGEVLLRQCTDPGAGYADVDDDCLDTNDRIHPGRVDVCNGLDDDCDLLVDDDDPDAQLDAWYADADGDGWGYTGSATYTCTPPAGTVPQGGDCDDTRATKNPAATEVCDGGIDNDCDGLVDDNDPDLAASTQWVRDRDGDGYGFDDPLEDDDTASSCLQPPGMVVVRLHPVTQTPVEDCNDGGVGISPGALEVCDGKDNDCDGLTDDLDDNLVLATAWYPDVDEDGWGDDAAPPLYACDPNASEPITYVVFGSDCDDTDPDVGPLAEEVCDGGTDNDCDGVADAADPDAQVPSWFPDVDGDGFGDAGGPGVRLCPDDAPSDAVSNDADCDDTLDTIYPGAPERCDLVDRDCDGEAQEPGAVDGAPYWPDADGDTFGAQGSTPTLYCADPGMGWATSPSDCNDTSDSVHPGMPELCDGSVDENCNGVVDELGAANGDVWFYDPDGDGFTDQAPVLSCGAPAPAFAWVASASPGDCSPFDPDVFPAAPDLCDGKRNDCDSIDPIDAGAPGYGPWYSDADNDGFGDDADVAPLFSCFPLVGRAPVQGDCDDSRGSVHPNQLVELCDGRDNDCDGATDTLDPDSPVVGAIPIFPDLDSDGWGVTYADGTTFEHCPGQPLPDRFATLLGDCDDGQAAIHPGLQEVCDPDGRDENCNGFANNEDGNALGKVQHFFDGDEDGFGESTVSAPRCVDPFERKWSLLDGDCDDTDPQAVTPTEWGTDLDGDGWAATQTVAGAFCVAPMAGLGRVGDCDDGAFDARPFAFLTVATVAQLQTALDLACDPTTIELAPGIYNLNSVTWPSGVHITLIGTNAILRGSLVFETGDIGTLSSAVWELPTGQHALQNLGGDIALENITFDGSNLATTGFAPVHAVGGQLDAKGVECVDVPATNIGCLELIGVDTTLDSLRVQGSSGFALVASGGTLDASGVTVEGYDPAQVALQLTDIEANIDDVEVFGQGVLSFEAPFVSSGALTVQGLNAFGFDLTSLASPGVDVPAITVLSGTAKFENAFLFGFSDAAVKVGNGSAPLNDEVLLTLDHATVLTNGVGVDLRDWDGANPPKLTLGHSAFAENGADLAGMAGVSFSGAYVVFGNVLPAGCTPCVQEPADFMAFGTGPDTSRWRLAPFPRLGGNLSDVDLSTFDDDGTFADIGFTGGLGGFTADIYASEEDVLPDIWERQLVCPFETCGFDPEDVCTTLGDADGDGLSDVDEYLLGTHPVVADSDGDLVDDGSDCAPLDPFLTTGCP